VKIKPFFIVIVLCVFINGCWGALGLSPVIFAKVKIDQKFNNSSIAVLPGFAAGENTEVAKELIKKLGEDKRISVIPYEQTLKKIPDSSVSLLGDDFSGSNDRFSNWLSENNRLRVLEINKSIGAGYVLVFWTDKWRIARNGKGEKIVVNVFTRLISYPQNEIVGYSYFGFETGVPAKAGDERFNETKRYMYDEIAKEISNKIKTSW
jgi:hypothetical protein